MNTQTRGEKEIGHGENVGQRHDAETEQQQRRMGAGAPATDAAHGAEEAIEQAGVDGEDDTEGCETSTCGSGQRIEADDRLDAGPKCCGAETWRSEGSQSLSTVHLRDEAQ